MTVAIKCRHRSEKNMTVWRLVVVILMMLVSLKQCLAFQQCNQIHLMSSLAPSNSRKQIGLFTKIPVQDSSEVDATLMDVIESLEIETVGIETFKKEPRSAFLVLALCWGVAFLCALDRVAMSVAMLPLSQEFTYTESMKGEVSSLFSVGYGLAILPCGLFLSVLSPKMIMANGIALWSLATLATPITASMPGMAPLLIARAAVGAAESVVLPSIQRFLSSWTSSDQKSIAVAVMFSGFQCGTIGAYTLSPYVMDVTEGWRGLFYTYGAVGLLALLPWLAFAEDSPNGVSCIDKEHTDTSSFDEAILTLKSAPWNDMVRSTGVQAIILAHMSNHWGLYINLAWAPTFYAEQYGMNVRDSAFLAVLPCIAGVVGGLISGGIADNILQSLEDRTDEAVTNVRKTFQGIALFGPAICLSVLAWHVPDQPLVAQTLLTGMVGLQAFNAAGYGAGIQDKAGEKW
jgi:MFS transporter, ACS family, solute carrier family 17 (sodium-dependent inorganic phosphate cotransporter), other